MNGNLLLLLAGILFSAIVIAITIIANKTRHPKALVVLFFTEMWERFSFYGMKAILQAHLTILFAASGLASEVAASNAQHMGHLFMAAVYATPMIGAIVADRLLASIEQSCGCHWSTARVTPFWPWPRTPLVECLWGWV